MRTALIGGTGIDEMEGFVTDRVVSVSTRYGAADVVISEFGGITLLFLPRHGLDHSLPPGQINYRAQIAALKKMEVERVIGVCAVGSLRPELEGGCFAVLGDFIDLTKRRADTFYDEPGAVVHTDFTDPYCPEISASLVEACREEEVGFQAGAVYVGVEGPRYETPAEIRLYSSWGAHVIGMTNLPEAVLAREAGLCYGALAVVSNLACGLSPVPLAHDDVRAAVAAGATKLQGILSRSIAKIPGERGCRCCSDNLRI